MSNEPLSPPSVLRAEGVSLKRRLLYGALSLAIGGIAWLPSVHFLYRPTLEAYRASDASDSIPPKARELAARHLDLWENEGHRQAELASMRGSNAEWDFMGRTFLVLALANMSLREPDSADRYLAAIDRIVEDTVQAEATSGQNHFLMDYARDGEFRAKGARSVFIDGEIALMMAARRAVREKAAYVAPLRRRVEDLLKQMRQSPVLCGESYPDECWTFCNTVALCAIKMQGVLDIEDRVSREMFVSEWLRVAKEKLVHAESGLLVSSFTQGGRWLDGPEGSTIWMVAHNLKLVDEAFARDQYDRARQLLACNALGFSYAREWPASWRNQADVDSGPIIPVVDASAGSSGTAFIGAGAFDDRPLISGLLTSLNFAGFPEKDANGLRYNASNQVGDAVLLYALVQGPLWEKVRCAR